MRNNTPAEKHLHVNNIGMRSAPAGYTVYMLIIMYSPISILLVSAERGMRGEYGVRQASTTINRQHSRHCQAPQVQLSRSRSEGALDRSGADVHTARWQVLLSGVVLWGVPPVDACADYK